jgi:hypothetical protein
MRVYRKKYETLVGKVINDRTVIKALSKGRVLVSCNSCGEKANVVGTNIYKVRCKCVREPYKIHGFSSTSEYISWRSMIERCTDPSQKHYKLYGGAGIKVCDRWLDIKNFMEDMGKKPTPKHTLDRKDSTKGYFPENCRWATPAEQARNRKSNILVELNGEKLCLKDYCLALNVNYNLVRRRLSEGKTLEEAVKPIQTAYLSKTLDPKEVKKLVDAGLTYKEVANKLGVKYWHIKRVYHKLKGVK